MPGCHPWFLFQVFPVTNPRIYRSFFPCDPNRAVTGNLVFIFGTIKKATLQKKKGKGFLKNRIFNSPQGKQRRLIRHWGKMQWMQTQWQQQKKHSGENLRDAMQILKQ